MHRHFIIHKPFGFISQFISNQTTRKNKSFPEGTMAIGRLDQNSEGLLLLTTDGIVSEQVRSKKVEKEYYIQVDGKITDTAIKELKLGVEIGVKGTKYKTLPCHAFRLDQDPEFPPRIKKIRSDRHGPTSWVSIIITEGKYKQVRKMSAAVGFPTLRLMRVRIGNVKLQDLEAGGVIEVAKFSI